MERVLNCAFNQPSVARAPLRGTGGGAALGCPTIIRATDTQAAGSPSTFFPSEVLRKLRAKPIQQLPSPEAYAVSIKFSAANAIFDDPGTLSERRDQDQYGSVIKDVERRFAEQRMEMIRMRARRHAGGDSRMRS